MRIISLVRVGPARRGPRRRVPERWVDVTARCGPASTRRKSIVAADRRPRLEPRATRSGLQGGGLSPVRLLGRQLGCARTDRGLAGTNVVKSLLDGCVVEENWTGAGGGFGRSLNFYDAASGTWSQMWVASSGCPNGMIIVEGKFEDGAMTMRGRKVQPGRLSPRAAVRGAAGLHDVRAEHAYSMDTARVGVGPAAVHGIEQRRTAAAGSARNADRGTALQSCRDRHAAQSAGSLRMPDERRRAPVRLHDRLVGRAPGQRQRIPGDGDVLEEHARLSH